MRRHARARLVAGLGRLIAVSGAVAIAAAALASPALGAYSHSTVELEFAVGGECMSVQDIAVAEPEGYVYVSCRVGDYPNERDQIKRFDLDGNPVPFSASAPYITGNTLTGDPKTVNGVFPNNPRIAIDNSGSPNHGKIFVTSSPHVAVFSPSGKYAGAVLQPMESSIGNTLGGVDVGPDGSVYVTSGRPANRVSKYNTNFQEIKRLYSRPEVFATTVDALGVDTTGAVWTRFQGALSKFEADQFTDELTPGFNTPESAVLPYVAKPSPFAPFPLPTLGVVGRFDIDLTDNDVYLSAGDRIETYSQGTAAESSFRNAPAFGLGTLSGSEAVAVTSDHHVYAATNGAKVVRFGPGAILPDPHTFVADVDDVGHEEVTVRGLVELAGGPSITDCSVEYGTDTTYSDGSAQCAPDAASSPPGSNFATDTEVSATLSGLTTGATYHYRLRAENAGGENFGIDRTVVPAYVLKVKTLPVTGVDDGGATLNGSFDPDGIATEYHFEYGVSTSYGLETEPVQGIGGSGVTAASTELTSLPKGKVLHYRLVAINANGTTVGEDRAFRTASPPDISGVRGTEAAATSARLNASINPTGYETTYRFEYGTTPDYGQSIPIPDASIGDGEEPVQVSQKIEGLQPGTTYHFKVVAENQWGVSESPDTTVDFTPPSCPNHHTRQETGASYLPDCRAYEIVSPGSAGSAMLVPSFNAAEVESYNEYSSGPAVPYIPNKGFASSPSRFTFFSVISTIEGLNSPIGVYDMYMSTRTNTGWVTTTPGLQSPTGYITGRKECSEEMDLCIDHSESQGAGFDADFSPYMYTSGGEFVGRLPTNVEEIPGGKDFVGGQKMSGDFSHFVFSSTEYDSGGPKPAIVFAPGGATTGLGSAYDNDIEAGTVTVVSKLANGDDIPLEGPKSLYEKGIEFRGLSPDGSHILMETPGQNGRKRLYMRVDQAITYDISRGADVEPIGMTRMGGEVLFITAAQLTEDDVDTSNDLYMWREDRAGGSEELTLVSQGNGEGNADGCNASWSEKCGVRPLKPEYAFFDKNRRISAPAMDDLFAEQSGDVYFFSPELLDASKPGIRNQQNLYVYRGGSVRLVATLDEGTNVSRMQIAADGAHAALRTASRLTSYDNKGFSQIYVYDAETGQVRCASCNPTGAAPVGNARASQGGRFMADDGRTFFSTQDALVPRDKNGRIMDTYEYVDGRPQLISSGLGPRDFTGGSQIISLTNKPEFIGLEHVSRDGRDVYFSTYETLVERDLNGQFIKFYDARTGGGFEEETIVAPCAAADECHGPDSSAPNAPEISSDGNFGSGGNAISPAKKKARAKAKRKRAKKAKRKRAQRRQIGGRKNG